MIKTVGMCLFKGVDVFANALQTLSGLPATSGTNIRKDFATLAQEVIKLPFDARPTAFQLDQAFMDCPKDLVWSFTLQQGLKVYQPLPYVVWRFSAYLQSRFGSEPIDREFITAYISFRMTLAQELESTQKEYLSDLNSLLANPHVPPAPL